GVVLDVVARTGEQPDQVERVPVRNAFYIDEKFEGAVGKLRQVLDVGLAGPDGQRLQFQTVPNSPLPLLPAPQRPKEVRELVDGEDALGLVLPQQLRRHAVE